MPVRNSKQQKKKRGSLGSSQTWRSLCFKPGCAQFLRGRALLPSLAPFCALLQTCIYALLRSFALFCVFLRLDRPCLGTAHSRSIEDVLCRFSYGVERFRFEIISFLWAIWISRRAALRLCSVALGMQCIALCRCLRLECICCAQSVLSGVRDPKAAKTPSHQNAKWHQLHRPRMRPFHSERKRHINF